MKNEQNGGEEKKTADRREESCLAAIYIFMSQKTAEELGRKQTNLHGWSPFSAIVPTC